MNFILDRSAWETAGERENGKKGGTKRKKEREREREREGTGRRERGRERENAARRARKRIYFSLRLYRRMRCMPHVALLSSVKVPSKTPCGSGGIVHPDRSRFRRKMFGRRHLAASPHLRTVHGSCRSLRLSSCLRGLSARVPGQKIYLRNGGHVVASVARPKTRARATTINNKLFWRNILSGLPRGNVCRKSTLFLRKAYAS